MKIKFGRKDQENAYEEFEGEETYYGGFEEDGGFAEDDVFTADSMHQEPQASPFGAVALKIVSPKGYENAAEIADLLLNGNTVLLNIENLTRENAVRLLDYLSGAIRMIGGLMTKVGKTTIVVAPKNVDVSSIEAMVGTSED